MEQKPLESGGLAGDDCPSYPISACWLGCGVSRGCCKVPPTPAPSRRRQSTRPVNPGRCCLRCSRGTTSCRHRGRALLNQAAAPDRPLQGERAHTDRCANLERVLCPEMMRPGCPIPVVFMLFTRSTIFPWTSVKTEVPSKGSSREKSCT